MTGQMDRQEFAQEFSRRLRMLLEDGDVSHNTLAKAIGVERSTVSNWARGHRVPSIEQLIAICEFFQVPITHFFDEPVEVIRFHDPELNEMWREASNEIKKDVGEFLRFLSEREHKKYE